MYRKFIAYFLLFITLIISGNTMASFFNTSLNAEEFQSRISGKEKESILSNIEIADFILQVDKINDITFKNSKWTNINASKKIFENIRFEDCELTNVNFRNITLINVIFSNCKLKNVVMNDAVLRGVSFIDSKLVSTDPNIDNNYLELDIDKVLFKNSELTNIGFYKSKGVFVFDEAKLNDVSGQSLKAGSALFFNRVDGFDLDFSRSNLSTLEVKSSTIKNSKANGCTIGKLLFDQSDLDFPISDGIKFDSVNSKNTGNVVIAGTPTKKTYISGCPKSTRILMVGGDKFGAINIQNCNPSEIILFESIGDYISIENVTVSVLDFRLSTIEHLKLNNVHIRNKLYYDSTTVKKLEATNISFGENMKHRHKDANIEIKADK